MIIMHKHDCVLCSEPCCRDQQPCLTSPPRIHLFQQQAMQGEREGIKEKQTEALLAHSSIMAHLHFSPQS